MLKERKETELRRKTNIQKNNKAQIKQINLKREDTD